MKEIPIYEQLSNTENILFNYTATLEGKYPTSTRRHSSHKPLAIHMGFYEQNLKNSPEQTWKLYESTEKNVLISLKPILQYLSNIYHKKLSMKSSVTCPTEFGLFRTIFTTIVINTGTCHWHVDPKDKLAVLIYFGDFTGG